jgi:hypothetical protein
MDSGRTGIGKVAPIGFYYRFAEGFLPSWTSQAVCIAAAVSYWL